MYGSRIKKRICVSKVLCFWFLVGELQDKNYNGELVQVGPQGSTGSGSVAGVCLYREGFYVVDRVLVVRFQYNSNRCKRSVQMDSFNYGANDGNTVAKQQFPHHILRSHKEHHTYTGSYNVLFHAPYGELNHSNNPTYYDSTDTQGISSGSLQYIEQPKRSKTLFTLNF